ncbi:MAG: hypothetical protein JXR77_14560 [Lentisphaeria bacterium]|nr:hypothetical protein [Lentisphaeria bacterium]
MPRFGLACVIGSLWSVQAAAQVPDDIRQEYREIRKSFFLVMPLSPEKDGQLRREITRFGSKVTAFIKAAETVAPRYQAAAYYCRGRLEIKLRRNQHARRDFDRCLEGMAKPGETPQGAPTEGAVRVYRAFTFLEEGHDAVMAQLAAIPTAAERARYYEVGRLVTAWADALADAEKEDLALRAYEFIRSNGLWEDEADDPQRKIELLRIRQGTTEAGNSIEGP